MRSNKQVADALRAMAELYETSGPPHTGQDCVSWGTAASSGRGKRIRDGLDDVTTEPYETEHTKYIVYRGRLLTLGLTVEVMESQDD
jgi:hypothetical protein